MTENEFWDSDTIEIEDGFVHGRAVSRRLMGDVFIVASVTSYKYERRGVERMNHVPHVVIYDENGIIKELTPSDTQDEEEAIERARTAAKNASKNLAQWM